MTRDLILLVADRNTGEVMQAGKPSGLQIVPKEPDDHMHKAGDKTAKMDVTGAWVIDPTHCYHAMLAASRVDLSGAEVKLPEPSAGTEGPDDYGDGRNEVIRDIQAQMKGE